MFAFYNSINDIFKWGESSTYQLAKSFTFMHWRRKWQPTPVFLPGESQGRGSLMGCHLWGRTDSGHDWSDLAAAAAEASSWNSQNKKHLLNPSDFPLHCLWIINGEVGDRWDPRLNSWCSSNEVKLKLCSYPDTPKTKLVEKLSSAEAKR